MKKFIILAAVFVLAGQGCLSSGQTDTDAGDAVGQGSGAEHTEQIPTEKETDSQTTTKHMEPGDENNNTYIQISTNKGDIVFRLFENTAPKAVDNFVTLTEKGFYDGLTFHRRVEGFVVQGGDPKGTGAGGPGYTFEDELDDKRPYDRGVVAMANRGPDTNGSQFFIMLADNPLPKQYTIFGEIVEGMNVVDELVIGDVMERVEVEKRDEQDE